MSMLSPRKTNKFHPDGDTEMESAEVTEGGEALGIPVKAVPRGGKSRRFSRVTLQLSGAKICAS